MGIKYGCTQGKYVHNMHGTTAHGGFLNWKWCRDPKFHGKASFSESTI